LDGKDRGRYKAILVEKVYLLGLARYIVLNPVRAGLLIPKIPRREKLVERLPSEELFAGVKTWPRILQGVSGVTSGGQVFTFEFVRYPQPTKPTIRRRPRGDSPCPPVPRDRKGARRSTEMAV